MARANQSQASAVSKEAEETDDKDLDMIPVGPGADLIEEEDPKESKSTEEDSEGDEGSEEDSRLSEDAEGDDDDRELLRAMRRKKRKNRKENIHRDRLELNFLRDRNQKLEQRLDTLENRTVGTEIATIDGRINEVNQQISLADQIIQASMESSDPGRGADFVKAQRARDQLLKALSYLENQKASHTSRANGRETSADAGTSTQQAPVKVPELQRRRAQEWFSGNSWYRPDGSNVDSKKVQEIDNQIASEGFDPSTHDYWDEFEDRVKQSLPHRYDGDDDSEEEEEKAPARKKVNGKAKASGGPKFTIGGQQRTLNPGEVYITPERRKALEDAGVWDDPKLRKRFLQRYADWDKRNGSSRSN